jgi:hypothetical protein
MAAEALLQAGLTVAGPNAAESFLLSNLQIEAPLRFLTDRPVDAEVVVRRGASGYDCQLQSHFTNAAGQRSPKPRVHAIAQLPSPSAAVAIPDELIAPLQENELAGMFEVPIRDDLVLYHGPAFRQLRAMGLDGDSAIATVEVPPNERLAGPARRVDDWRTNPAVLDACLFAAGVHLYARREGTIAVPLGIERLVFRRPCPVGERVTVRLRQREITPREASFDFALLDADGEPCLVALGYRAALVVQGTQSRGAHA